ncbi:MAG TPA: alkaline phosphatase D family protein, partial [Chthoniobacterales bacterium]
MRLVLALFVVALAFARADAEDEQPLKRVAFGSCTREYKPQPLWKAIIAAQPDVWIWLGDIVYGEADNLTDLAARYRTLKAQPDYTALRAQTKVLGVWDDHDYGTTNGGSDNPHKRDVQRLLLDFLDEPPESARRTQEGVYAAYSFGPPGKQVKV